MNRRVFSIALFLTGLLAGAAGAFALPGLARADALDDIKKRGKLLVAIDLGTPPFGMTDANMQPVGSEVDSARLLAGHLRLPLEIVQVTSPNRIPFLLTGKADVVMASFSVSEERKKVIDFSNAYGVIQIIIAAPKENRIVNLEDLAGKRIGTTRGSTNDKEITALVKNAEIVRYDDDATLVTALVSGQVDIMGSAPQIMAAVNQRRSNDPLESKIVLKTNPYAIGLRKEEGALRAALNEWIAQDLANGKLREIYVSYHGVPLPETLPATD